MLNMRIAVKAHPHQKEEWLSGNSNNNVELLWVDDTTPSADAYFDLSFEEYGTAFGEIKDKPVFMSAVAETLNELPLNASRINAWKGFFGKGMVEVVLRNEEAKKILDSLEWKYCEVPDVPGMIAPRTISMIINEAYFALGDEVSSKEEIDIAMKLGTNYPYGPFEWSRLIGLHNVYRLLKKLSSTDNRYQPAPALEQELKTIA
jgi:3-hydroxybutyryl-CoA dehydrogenase